jgi:hypothetical protein
MTLPKKILWPGRAISAIPIWFLLVDATAKLVKPAPIADLYLRIGYPDSVITGLGILLLVCIIIHVIPRTAILGAILLTGYLGGATAILVRIGDTLLPILLPSFLGVLIWGGLYLRDERLRALVCLRKSPAH